MWNQKLKGILFALGSLCLLQNANAVDVDGFKVEGFYETDNLIFYNKKIAMFMYEGAYCRKKKVIIKCSVKSKEKPR